MKQLTTALTGITMSSLLVLAACGDTPSASSATVAPAITDDLPVAEAPIDVPAPDVEPLPVEPGEPGEATEPIAEPTEPTDQTETGAEPTEPGAAEPTPTDEMENTVELDDAQILVGLDEADAATQADELGWLFRVTERDGQPQMMTMDLRMNRVNVSVVDGVVTAITSIG